MKRRMLSVLLSVMLVIATICVSNMPSRAVEPSDEVTQEEMQARDALENAEVTTEEVTEAGTEAATEEMTEEGTEATTEEVPEETIETIVEAENSEPQTDAAVNESGNEKNGQENEDGITKKDAVDFDADTETAGDIENDEMSVENSDEVMMLPDEETTEEAAEEITEITEEMPEGAEVEKLENVDIRVYNEGDIDSYTYDKGSIVAGKERGYAIQIYNDNKFDIYLYSLTAYVTDEKGNEYNVPVFAKWSGIKDDMYVTTDITNDTKGYLGHNNGNVLTGEKVSAKKSARYSCSVVVPE